MTQLQAWQHIYSNVEKEQSPGGRGGFQTLFYTKSALTGAEVEEIEPRLLYYATDAEPVKHVFFPLSTGKTVLGQVVSLPGKDNAGREGRYISHSLVLSSQELSCIGSKAIRVFKHYPFITTIEEALEKGDLRTGDMPATTFTLPDEEKEWEIETAKLWPVEELKRWTLLALGADRLAADQSAVAVMGSPDQMEEAIAAAFVSVPTARLTACAFDTFFYRCNLVASYFWAVGLPEPPASPKFVLLDARSHRVLSEKAESPQTSYERWALEMLSAPSLEYITRHKDRAFPLCEWLDERMREVPTLNADGEEVLQSVLRVNSQKVRERLGRKLKENLPPTLAERIFEHVYSQSGPIDLLKLLADGIDLSQVPGILYAIYASGRFIAPKKEEMKALDRFLKQNDHRDLRLLCICWAGQHKDLRRLLEKSSPEEYRGMAQTILNFGIVKPPTLFLPGRGDAFLNAYLSSEAARGESLMPVVGVLIGKGEASCLAQLVPHLPKRSPRELRALEKIARKRKDIPRPLRDAVLHAAQKLPRQKGLGGLIKALFARNPLHKG